MANLKYIGKNIFNHDLEVKKGNVIGDHTEVIKVTVVSDGGNKYAFEGTTTPDFTIDEGKTYRFDQSDSSNDTHPLRFSIVENGTWGGGSAYSTGVTTHGTAGTKGAYTEINVTKVTPNHLYYYCVNHSGMGNDALLLKNDFSNLHRVSGSSVSTGSFGRGEVTTLEASSFGSSASTLISGSINSVSSSISTRLTTEEGNVDTLQARDLIAGTGLTGGGTLSSDRTFNVVGGTGITANANDIQVDFSDSTLQTTISGSLGTNATLIRSLTAAGISGSFTPTSSSLASRLTTEEGNVDTLQARDLIAGAGLTGGGTLASDRTFNVVGGTGITANVNDIEIDFSDSTLQTTISGSVTSVSSSLAGRITTVSSSLADRITTEEGNVDTLQARDLIAGAGLTGGGTLASDRTFNVGAGTGVTVNANDVAIGQAVATSDNVTFGSVTTTGNISGSSTSTGSFGKLYINGTPNNKTAILNVEGHAEFADGNIALLGSKNIKNYSHAGTYVSFASALDLSSQAVLSLRSNNNNANKWYIGLDGSITGSTGNHLSLSSTSTGSFGRVESNTFNATTFTSTEVTSTNLTVTGTITGSSLDVSGNGNFGGDLVVGGDITAENYIVKSNVTQMTQSFSSGSTIFGDTSDDTHQFTGSLSVSGSNLDVRTDTNTKLRVRRNNHSTAAIELSFRGSTGGLIHATSKELDISTAESGISLLPNNGIVSINDNSTQTVKPGALSIQKISGINYLAIADNASSGAEGNIFLITGSNGNVGIANKDPQEKLDVTGNIQASGNISGSSTSTGSFGHLNINGPGDNVANFQSGNRTLSLKLNDSAPSGDVGVQFRAGASDYLGLAAGGGSDYGIVIHSNNNVAIGHEDPEGKLHIYSGDAGGSSAIFNQADELVIENSNHAGITIKSPNDKETSVFFGDQDDSSRGGIRYDHATDKMKFQVAVTSLELTSTKISGSSSSTGSFGAVSIGKGTADNQRALTVVGNVQLDNNNAIYFKRSTGTADPHIIYNSNNDFNIFNPLAGEIKFAVGSAEVVVVDSGGLTFNGSKTIGSSAGAGVITITGNSGLKLKSGAGGGSGPIELIQGSTTYWSVGPEGNLTGSADLVMNAGKNISGSSTSTGSFDRITTNKITRGHNQYPRDIMEFGNYSRIYLNKDSNSINAGLSVYNASSAANDPGLSVYQGDSDAPAIVTSGNNASISGSSTSTGSFGHLHVAAVPGTYLATLGNFGLNIKGDSNSTGTNFRVRDGSGNTRFNVHGYGQTGIGTDSAQTMLHIVQTSLGLQNSIGEYIRIEDASNYSGSIGLGSNGTLKLMPQGGDVNIASEGSSVGNLTVDGKVHIGSANTPTNHLEVEGGIYASTSITGSNLLITGSAAPKLTFNRAGNGSADIYYNTNGTGLIVDSGAPIQLDYTTSLRILKAGSETARFTGNGGLAFGDTSSTTSVLTIKSDSNSPISFEKSSNRQNYLEFKKTSGNLTQPWLIGVGTDATGTEFRVSNGSTTALTISSGSGNATFGGNVSGSSTSTGSFGNLRVGDRIAHANRFTAYGGNEGFKIGYAQSGFLASTGAASDGADAEIVMTGTGGSAPFDQHGSIVYKTRAVDTLSRSSHIFYTGRTSAERVRIDHDGNLGIGTAAPSSPLHVYNANSSLNIKVERGDGSSGIVSAGGSTTFFGTDDTTDVEIGTNSTTRMFIDHSETAITFPTITKISGSSTSTGSFARGIIADTLEVGSTYGTAPAIKSNNGIDLGAVGASNSKLRFSGDDIMIRGDGSGNMTFHANSDFIFKHSNGQHKLVVDATKVSGSATSTGSFGSLVVADKVQGDLEIKGNLFINDGGLDLDSGQLITGQKTVNGTAFTFLKMYDPGDASIQLGSKHSLGYISFQAGNGSFTERMRIKNNGDIAIFNSHLSGSSTSTGSFGRVEVNSISASLYQGQIGSRYVHSQTSDSATWTINHNIGQKYPVVTVYDDSDQMILPQNGVATDSDTFTLTFNEAIQGKAVVSVGGIGENAGGNYIFTQDSSTTNWRVTHSLSQQYPNVTVYDGSNQVIIPESITAASSNEMDITFSDAQSGYANFSIGSGIPNISSENAGKVLKVRYGGQGVEWSPTSSDVSGSMSVSGSIIPNAHNSHDLGSDAKRWRNIYSADLQLSNENTEGNEVDGTTGNWTIQEGEDDLYLLNRKNGKKYKFKLEEIT